MTVVTVPGEYYEKVYSNSITTMRHLLLSNVLSSFDIYSIVRRNEETMLINEQIMNSKVAVVREKRT